jgi:hypothetical protein
MTTTSFHCEVSWDGKTPRHYKVKDITTSVEICWTDFKDKKLLQILCAKLNVVPESTNNIDNMKDCLRAYFKTKTVAFVFSTVPDNPTVHLENERNEDKSTPEVTSSHPKDIEIDAKCNQEEVYNESKVSCIVL